MEVLYLKKNKKDYITIIIENCIGIFSIFGMVLDLVIFSLIFS
jgi:hypothetical protein